MSAETWRDALGVPHVRADTMPELAREQGRVTAADRTWQLEHQRRRATGTAAEVLGRPQVGWDTLVRRVRVVDTAQRALAGLSREARTFLAAYVEGVNAGLVADAVGALDAAGGVPRPARAVHQPARQAVAPPCARRAG